MSTEPIKVKSWSKYLKEHPDFTGCLIDSDNDISWYKNGEQHRENGPAMEWSDGNNWWYLNGTLLKEQEHRLAVRQMKLKLLDTSQSTL